MSVVGNLVPISIQVMTQAVDSIVTEENSVRIHLKKFMKCQYSSKNSNSNFTHHRKNLEHNIFPQNLCDRMICNRQELNKTLNDVRTWRFHWMDSSHHHNDSYRIFLPCRLLNNLLRFLDIIECDQFDATTLHAVDQEISLDGKLLFDDRQIRL